MTGSLFISHASALAYWRTNPPWYVLEGRERDIRSVRNCMRRIDEFRSANVPESEFGPGPIDILVPAANPPRCPDGFRVHKVRQQLPRHALCPLWDGVYVVSPELCFVQMCQSLSFAKALELGMELCGTYALRQGAPEGMAQRSYKLINADTLQRRLQSWRGLKGLPLARKVAKYLVGGSASPMETKLFLLLCLPLQYGGYNLGRPELNPKLDLTPAEMEIVRTTHAKPDLLWRKQGLIVEYDGRQHEETQQSKHDALRATVLEGKQYSVRRVMRFQLYDPLAFDSFASSVRSYLRVRNRPVTLKQEYARDQLRLALLGARGDGEDGGR